MCDPSKIDADWITKGCHIDVGGVELAVYPDHVGRIGFRPVFSSTPRKIADKAIKTAVKKCLPNPSIRKKWIQFLQMATVHMLAYPNVGLANGRMAEFKFLRIAIERAGE